MNMSEAPNLMPIYGTSACENVMCAINFNRIRDSFKYVELFLTLYI